MRDVLILQHSAPEGPGAIATALLRRDLDLRVVRICDGEAVPETLADSAALIVMGGPMGVYEADRHPHLRDELRLIEDALRRGRPVLGICLGSQLLAAALGARVYPSGGSEVGWYRVDLTSAAAADLFAAAPRHFTALHWHGDVFDLPAGAVHLASSQRTTHQAFRHGDSAYGLLFHLEATAPQLDAMVTAFADEIAGAGLTPAALLDGAAAHLSALSDVAAAVFDRFALKIHRQDHQEKRDH